MNDQSYWLARFARLRIDTASNAPHKPLLLLVVLDLAQEGALSPETLPLTPQLAFAFCSYWRIVAHRRKQKPDVRWPFTKLQTDGVWTPLDCCRAPPGAVSLCESGHPVLRRGSTWQKSFGFRLSESNGPFC